MPPKKPTQKTRRILVSGDVMVDNHIYKGDRYQPGLDGKIGTYLQQTAGGASLLYDQFKAVLAYKPPEPKKPKETGDDVEEITLPHFDVDLGVYTDNLSSWPRSLHSFGVWSPHPHTRKDNEKKETWRLSAPLGYGEEIDEPFHAPPCKPLLGKSADILVLDDGGLTFRHKLPKNKASLTAWPTVLSKPTQESPEWTILKTASPLAQGDLWRAVVDKRIRESLIVITSIADVRREPVRISEGVSWERTALELVRELINSPSLEPLARCPHCIISFGCAGVLYVDRTGKEPSFRLIFDPAHLEGDWEATMDGSAIGYMSCLVTGIVNGLVAIVKDEDKVDRVGIGIVAGLEAGRAMLEDGHGFVEANTTPEPPWGAVASKIVTSIHSQLHPKKDQKKQFYSASVPIPNSDNAGSQQRHNWTILAGEPSTDDTDRLMVQPLVGIARRTALFGISELSRNPVQHTGKLITVDRGEIESIRIVQRAIRAYDRHDAGKKPLSIALFGAPGSGKSFTVKEIARSVLGKKAPILEFNLSQFSGNADLIGALHQVRDGALGPYTPVVFWDEFDSRNYDWLQYLLAPMQDGAFQEGPLTHPIGKCVFIFAGGTSCDFEHFGPSPGNTKAVSSFKLLKGPDFKSRIHNSLTVLGPNRAPAYDDVLDTWKDDPADICFPIRRALLVRSLLGLGDDDLLEMDDGMLTALLEINTYTHGVRSLENLLSAMKQSNDGGPYRRSNLPNTEVLAMHVDADKFIDLMERDLGFKRLADELAPHIHAYYTEQIKDKRPTAEYNKIFNDLPEEIKDDNRSAARRIPEVLAHAGLYVVKRAESENGKAAKLTDAVQTIIDTYIEEMAEAEHNGWMITRLSNGWRYGKTRINVDKIHHNLIPYSELDRETKDLDVNSVQNYKTILALENVNYTITNEKPS